MKPLRILTRSISSAFKSVFRNLSLSIASISCIIITLIIVSFSLMAGANVNNFTSDIENDLTIVVFVKKDATEENIEQLTSEIKSVPNIKDINYSSREDVKNEMQNENEAFKTIIM